MNDLERKFEEVQVQGAQLIHYEAMDADREDAGGTAAVAVTRGERTIMASIGWSPLGPYVDVFGFVDGDQVPVSSHDVNGRVSVGYAGSVP